MSELFAGYITKYLLFSGPEREIRFATEIIFGFLKHRVCTM